MTHRLSHILSLCLVFGSMWLHGVLAMPLSDHDMGDRMSPSCLEHCLSALHLGVSDDGIWVDATGVVEHPVRMESILPGGAFIRMVSVESHHDPSQILTTIKRE